MSGKINQPVTKTALFMINMALGALNKQSVVSKSGRVLVQGLPKYVSKPDTIQTQFYNMPQVTISLKHCSTFSIRQI
jgi:hypothetical protein